MPELPEVETLVQQLKKRVVGKKIVTVEILDRKVVDSKIEKIVPVKVKEVRRRAKSIIIKLEKGWFLLVHLRMSGHFHYIPQGKKLEKEYQRFIVAKFELNEGSVLTHNSIRKFGSIKLMKKEQLEKALEKLGPEPLSREFTLSKFREMLRKKKRANVKTTLLDQQFIAGIGNIYAQEALYWARIDPRRKIGELTEQEAKKLYLELRKVLQLAVKKHGTTIESYLHIEGVGGFQKHLAVYHQKKCPKGHFLKKINQGGRGTYYCSKCQS